jgi:hypothetical protein
MPPSPSDLPPWLRAGAGAATRGARGRRSAAAAGFALVLFGGGVLTGFLIAGRPLPAAPPAPPPACPPAVACAEGKGSGGAPAARGAAPAPARRAKPARAPLAPLPEPTQLDDGTRAQALREFAQKKGPELRECLEDPERGPAVKVGAAFEIGASGAVDFVQILGADGSSKETRRCYAARLKRWRFPKELLRGEEKLLVSFVL